MPQSKVRSDSGGKLMEDQKVIRLDQYLKLKGLVMSGGEAKFLIQDGQVRVNGEVDTRRSRKLRPGDRVSIGEHTLVVELDR